MLILTREQLDQGRQSTRLRNDHPHLTVPREMPESARRVLLRLEARLAHELNERLDAARFGDDLLQHEVIRR